MPPSSDDTPTTPHRPQLTYREAGVDIDAGNALVDAIKPAAQSTARPGSMGGLGGFGGLFDLAAAGYRDPILVGATDGVGTKLKIAIETGIHDTVGVDLVAMCVNDLIVQGAEPLFFLDYFGTGRLEVHVGADVVGGVAEGCRQAGCVLMGGETAELPGLYAQGDYDLAGFAVGAIERTQLLPRGDLALGDIVLALGSTGVHSNGFSLVRKIVERAGLPWSAPAPFDASQSLGRALLTPTRIYVRSVLAALKAGLPIKALAHITGGGLIENPPRVLPDHLAARLDMARFMLPPVFAWLKAAGQIADQEMLRTFNCGVGMIAIVSPEQASAVQAALSDHGEVCWPLGVLEQRDAEAVIFDHLDRFFG